MEKLYKIEQPKIETNISLFPDKYLRATLDPEVREAFKKTEYPYLHWQDLKYKNWLPSQFKNDKKGFWTLVKFWRREGKIKAPIKDAHNQYFNWEKLDYYEQMLHEIDLDMSKYLLTFPEISEAERQKYQQQGIIEEAIASSQLEGAHTTRKAAKQMIREKRDPKTYSERMIYNNFITMKAIQEKYKDEKLSLEILFEIHRALTKENLKEEEQGQFRTDEDEIVITKGDDPSVISYIAPNVEFVKKEIKNFIAFANDELDEKNFIHPVIKAIMLHFWIGLLHPFVDGNGRMARALFYWYLLRKGYWAFAFLPISIAIKKAPAQYSEAYILSEQDDNDLNYFIDYHLRKISQAIDEFRKYIKDQIKENEEARNLFLHHKTLNDRQIEILISFKKDPHRLLNVTTHKNIYEITKVTAIKDLKKLEQLGFVKAERRGKNIFYLPTKKAIR